MQYNCVKCKIQYLKSLISLLKVATLRYRINVQLGNKHAGENNFQKRINMQDQIRTCRATFNAFLYIKFLIFQILKQFNGKLIIVQDQIRPCKVDFFLEINNRACTFIQYRRVGHNRCRTKSRKKRPKFAAVDLFPRACILENVTFELSHEKQKKEAQICRR